MIKIEMFSFFYAFSIFHPQLNKCYSGKKKDRKKKLKTRNSKIRLASETNIKKKIELKKAHHMFHYASASCLQVLHDRGDIRHCCFLSPLI